MAYINRRKLKNIKNLNVKNSEKTSRMGFLLALCLMVIYLPALISCGSKELTRSQAQKMVASSREFKDIKSLDYINRSLRDDRNKGTSVAKSPDEPEAAAVQGRIGDYFVEEPRVGIASHLGLVKPELKRINEKPEILGSLTPSGFWYFEENYTLTDKGKKYWGDYELPVQETVIPTAKKEFINVTGITGLGETDAQVEFTWRWLPNELGKSLDPSTEEFKRLPENLKTNLTSVYPYPVSPFIADWGNERFGSAQFQKYDDGWRLINVSFK